jgi:predicted DNA-binding transcriptional regulator AlpA
MATAPKVPNPEMKPFAPAAAGPTLVTTNQIDNAAKDGAQVERLDDRSPEKRYLSSWKEIAKYIGLSQRTIQRWERSFGLPVHRPTGSRSGAVIAIAAEIDEWILKTPAARGISEGREQKATSTSG